MLPSALGMWLNLHAMTLHFDSYDTSADICAHGVPEAIALKDIDLPEQASHLESERPALLMIAAA